MDSQEEQNADGNRHNAATENSDTVALHKKRARRVSFAEMTSVHFFDRDDEEYNGTPLMQSAKIDDDSAVGSGSGGRIKEAEGEHDGDNNDEDDEEMEMRRMFLRPIRSPSPGGSTLGSASSNDEDKFFGPLSTNFIRPGQLSDSAASDDNHDVTMDSTAFSMHFRSLARSESGLDLKTPTGGQLFFEEKTPTNSNTGSSMVVTLGKKPFTKSSVPMTEVSGSHSSNDMSLVGGDPNKYDYDKLSPGLDAILAEGRKNLLCASVSDDITSVSPKKITGQVFPSVDLGDNLINFGDSVREETGRINYNSVLNGDESAGQHEIGETNSAQGNVLSGPSSNLFSTCTLGAATNRDNRKPNSSSYQLGKNGSDMSLVPSTFSPVKQEQIRLTAAFPSKPPRLVSPSPEQPGSLLKNRSVEHQYNETSIQRSISKLELLERYTFSSAFSAKIDKSTIKSLDFSKSPYDNLSAKNHHIAGINFAEDLDTEEKAAGAPRSTEDNSSFNMDHARGENNLKVPLYQIMSGKSPNEFISKEILADQSKFSAPAGSPSKINWSGDNLERSLFTIKHNNDDSLMIETDSLLAEIASCEGGKAITPEFVPSPGRMLVRKLSASPGFQSSQANDLLLPSQIEHIEDIDNGQGSTSDGNVALSSATANMGALSKGMNGELNSTYSEVNHLNLIELKSTDNKEIYVQNRKEIIGTTSNFSTPAKENKSQVVHSENLVLDNLTSSGFSSFKDNIPGAESRMVSNDSDPPPANKNLDQPRLQNLVLFPAGSQSRKEADNKQPSGMLSPKSIQLSSELKKFSANKRNLELLLRDTQHRTDMTIVGRSPKLLKGGNYESETIVYPVEGRSKLPGHEKKWADIYSKFTEDLKVLILGSAKELHSKMIDELEDKLVHQQRSKLYEMFYHGVMHKNTIVHHDLQLDKIAEANSLLHRVVFEKAKLQLKQLKRERLLKKLELLSSRIQESLILGANVASLPLEACTSNVQIDAVGDRSWSVNLKKKNEVCQEELTAMRQALKALDRKILNLTRTFHAWCKMKAEPGSGDTIDQANEYLVKRASCRSIRLDMQMWVVDSVGSVNGQQDIFLNYLDFIVQSTKLILGPTSSARTSFKLNEANIRKNFPNMDACKAFAFVFGGETIHKYIGAKTLVQETQVSNSLLGTLLDVIEEVQLAQMEFLNLTQICFCSPSAERLDLMLCFSNFNSGRKVVLTLDMSCLKCGIYPSEILPLQTASSHIGSKKCSYSGPICDEIRSAVKGVRTGYMRILRLCRCVSRVVQPSTA